MRRRLVLLVVALLALLSLAIAWTWTPLRAWLDVDLIVTTLRDFGQAFGPLAAIVGFSVALTLAIPLSFLTLVALVVTRGVVELRRASRYDALTGLLNLVAGASHIRLRDLLLGTVIGMAPSTLAMAFFVDQIAAAMRHPTPLTYALVLLTVVLIAVGAWALNRWLRSVQ